MTTLTRRLAPVAYPAAGVAAMLVGWWLLVAYEVVPNFLLPSPFKVLREGWSAAEDGTLWRHLAPTLQASALGYGTSAAIAFTLAALIAESRIAERFLYAHLVAIQSIPKVSIAPLVFLWAGFDIAGKVVLVTLICFFPIFANALAGFRAADPNLLDLLRAAGASRWHRFMHVKVPTAASFLFAGLEVAVAFALIGCVVMEFIGSTRGMGFMIQDASNTYNLGLSFAAIVMLGLLGVAGNAGVRALRRRVLHWEKTPGDA